MGAHERTLERARAPRRLLHRSFQNATFEYQLNLKSELDLTCVVPGFVIDVVNRHHEEVERRLESIEETGNVVAAQLS